MKVIRRLLNEVSFEIAKLKFKQHAILLEHKKIITYLKRLQFRSLRTVLPRLVRRRTI